VRVVACLFKCQAVHDKTDVIMPTGGLRGICLTLPRPCMEGQQKATCKATKGTLQAAKLHLKTKSLPGPGSRLHRPCVVPRGPTTNRGGWQLRMRAAGDVLQGESAMYFLNELAYAISGSPDHAALPNWMAPHFSSHLKCSRSSGIVTVSHCH